MKKLFYYLLLATTFTLIGWFANTLYHLPKSENNPISQVKPRPLEKYSIENLANAQIDPVEIEIGEIIKEEKEFTSYKFSMLFDPTLSGKEKKKVTGLVNIPNGTGTFPIVVMLRGYVDQKIFKTGDGTRRAGEYFAKNGLITIAPDFLGYGESDSESENIFESRFQTYTTSLVLLNSLNSIESWNGKDASIWAHSNGGQVALTILEISQVEYPTVLWAPVSKPFPYSILYYTDESDDHGKLIRRELAEFEKDYDVEKYSLTNYLDRVKAPIQLHQGTFDDAIPVEWSTILNNTLKKLELEIEYIKHPGADHDMNPLWNEVIFSSLNFFQKNVKKTT